MKRAFLIISMGFLVAGFQNCQKAEISSASTDASAKVDGNLIPVTANDPEDASGSVLQPGELQTSNTITMEPPVVPPPAPGNGNHVDSNSGDYVCILEGPGKSVKLGIDSRLQGQNPVPGVLCMSANACLKIASQAFGVKGPEFRGYCKLPHGNPHVSHITGADLQAKVTAQLKK